MSNPHSPPGTTGRVTDTNRPSISVQQVLRGGGRRKEGEVVGEVARTWSEMGAREKKEEGAG